MDKSVSQIDHEVFFLSLTWKNLTCKMYTKVILVYTPASRVILGGKYSDYNLNLPTTTFQRVIKHLLHLFYTTVVNVKLRELSFNIAIFKH